MNNTQKSLAIIGLIIIGFTIALAVNPSLESKLRTERKDILIRQDELQKSNEDARKNRQTYVDILSQIDASINKNSQEWVRLQGRLEGIDMILEDTKPAEEPKKKVGK